MLLTILLHGKELIRGFEPGSLGKLGGKVVNVLRGDDASRECLLLCLCDKHDVVELLLTVASTKANANGHVHPRLPLARVNRNPLVPQTDDHLLVAVLADKLMCQQGQIAEANLCE